MAGWYVTKSIYSVYIPFSFPIRPADSYYKQDGSAYMSTYNGLCLISGICVPCYPFLAS